MRNLTLFGVTGRMGEALLRELAEPAADESAAAAGWRLTGAVASAGSARLGERVGPPPGVAIVADPAAALVGAQVAIDFSHPAAAAAHASACAAAGVPLLVGTTGLDPAAVAALAAAAERVPVLVAPNTGVGVNVMAKLVALAAQALGADADVEILEAHHRFKRDAPSGTALALGEAVAAARGEPLRALAAPPRQGTSGPRERGQIGFAVLRAGDIVGEHTVLFGLQGERLEITHRATDRGVFARGALRAAAWLAGQPPGRYSMSDVLNLSGSSMDRSGAHR